MRLTLHQPADDIALCLLLLLLPLLPFRQVWDLAQGTCVQTVVRAHDSAITSILRWESVSCCCCCCQVDTCGAC